MSILSKISLRIKKTDIEVDDGFKHNTYIYRTASIENVEFQYPPILTSDDKSGNFTTQEANIYMFEPLKINNGGSPRTLKLEFSYAVDDDENWTFKRIQKQLSIGKKEAPPLFGFH